MTERKPRKAPESAWAKAQRIAHLGTWELELKSGRVTWSRETYRIFGLKPGAFRGSRDAFLIKVYPADRALVDEAKRRVLAGESALDVEYRILREDGSVRWVQELGELQRDPKGRPARLVGTILDLTERKLAGLRESEARRQAEADRDMMFNFSLDLLCVANFEGYLEQVNPAWTATLGWSAEELTSRPSIEFVHPEDRAATLAARGQIIGGKRYRDLQNRYLCKDGSFRWFSWHVHALEASRKVFGVVRDITEQKKLETQFLRAQRMQSIGTLAGGIAHDLNNTLSPIMMSLQLLRLRFADDDSRKILSEVGASAQRGADLVRQLLSFARGVEGRRLPVDLPKLMAEIKTVTRDAMPMEVEFGWSAEDGLWTVTGDSTQLHQVFLNLCLNARDAMPEGGRLTVELKNVVLKEDAEALDPDARPGSYVAARVIDTGTGIAADVQSRMFEPFFTTKEVGKGTGLGLSTAQTIVRSHGGFITVSSVRGRGTTFTVYLPAASGRAAARPSEVSTDAVPRGEGELVLIVDDEEAMRNVCARALEAFGYRVLAAANGREALDQYSKRGDEVAVVLTDMTMPVMDGSKLIVALRNLNPWVRIVGFSGLRTQAETGGEGVRPVRHFIAKPFTSDVLLRTLRTALTEPA